MSRKTWMFAAILVFGVQLGLASTIASRTGDFDVLLGNRLEVVSWSQTGTYSNVVVSAVLGGSLLGQPGTGDLYLTDSIGSGTTVANQLAFTTLTLPPFTGDTTPTVVFSGLTLGPGTYYLVLNSPTIVLSMIALNNTVEVTDVGASINKDLFSNTVDSYPPASSFTTSSHEIGFSVTGDLTNSVPEPSSLMLLGSGVAGIIGVIRRNIKR